MVALLIMVILTVVALVKMDAYETPGPVFEAFGIPIPRDYSIHGIDVSRYQQKINWRSVKKMKSGDKSVSFAFIKATEGLSNKDERFERNWQRAEEEDLVKGAYHYFISSKNGNEQADHFIHTVSLQSGDLPPVVDIEETCGVEEDQICSRLSDWLKKVESHYGVKPIIYTNVRFYEQYLAADFADYPLWIAHYLQSDRPRIGRNWWFWQHSESGRVSGIKAKVDFNVFNGDSSDFRKILIQ